ncbi:GNAT family N-acetyltransferase [Streptomyces sp. ODS05-4]|uniref:GNAT family N-acetyltransferase n=1 Tax=Streptomyces sp. ODS05-4 TaxID=2944939 RepID=UPI0021098139|nr:GNAT family N-acetyltransferase [Streptomyces sp. ODS05-4]
MSATGWDTEICRDGDAFGRLAGEWTALYRRCATATPFQSHSWLHSWWTSYGAPGRLRVVLVRRAGRLVAAAPLRLVPGPVPVLTHLGGAITDFSDVLLCGELPEEQADEAVRRLTAALYRMARTAVVDLREVRDGAAAHRVYAAWPGPRHRTDDSVCMELPALPIEGLVARLPSARAQRARSKLRRLDRLGIEERAVRPGEVPEALGGLLRLHQRQWEGRGLNPEHLSPRFREHLHRAVIAMVESGDAMLTEFRLDGDVVAADLTLLSPLLSGGYLYGADPRLRSSKADVATLLLRNGARESSTAGRTVLSLLRGRESYKSHWRPHPAVSRRLLMSTRRTGPGLLLRAGYAEARRRAADALRDREWVRRIRRR